MQFNTEEYGRVCVGFWKPSRCRRAFFLLGIYSACWRLCLLTCKWTSLVSACRSGEDRSPVGGSTNHLRKLLGMTFRTQSSPETFVRWWTESQPSGFQLILICWGSSLIQGFDQQHVFLVTAESQLFRCVSCFCPRQASMFLAFLVLTRVVFRNP